VEVNPGYKQTEVGVIPEDWHTEAVADLVEPTAPICYGVVQVGQHTESGVPIVAIKFVKEIARAPLHRTAISLEQPYARSRLKGGDVLISIKGTIGRVGIVPNGFEGNISRELARLRISKNTCAEYIAHQLEASATQERIMRSVVGTTRLEFSIATLRKFQLPLPPTDIEQLAIAQALSHVDGLLGGLDRLIAKKRDLKQAAMQQLLSGQTRLPGFGPTAFFKEYAFGSIPDDWDVKPLKSVSTMNGRIGWQGLKQEEFTVSPDDPFLITGMNFKDGKIRWDEVYHIPEARYLEALPIQLRANDLLMTKDGTIGKLLYVDRIPHPGRASLNSHLLVFRPIAGQYDPRFLFYQLSSPTFAQHIELHKSGTTFFGLSQTATGKYPTILPSVPEQTDIAEVLTEMDAELAALEQRREKTRALKQAMMQELLTGRIRLA